MQIVDRNRRSRPGFVHKLIQLGRRQLPRADIVNARLEDRELNVFDLVDHIEQGQGAGGVNHELGIVLGVDLHALTEFQIDDFERAVDQCGAVDCALGISFTGDL